MDRSWFGLIDWGIVAVAALGFGLWQYISVSREIARDRAAKEADEQATRDVGADPA
jgi:hypothetical protein